MHPNLRQFAQRSREFRPSHLRMTLERVRAHLLLPRMEPAEFVATIQALGYETAQTFADDIGLPQATAESWEKFGLSRDSAQLLLALLDYKDRLSTAIRDVDSCLNIGLGDFFQDYKLP